MVFKSKNFPITTNKNYNDERVSREDEISRKDENRFKPNEDIER